MPSNGANLNGDKEMSKAFKENPVAKIARESNEYIDLLEGKLQTALDLIAHAEQKHAELQGRIAELEIDNEELHKLWAETIAENKGLEADNARLREAIKDDCPTSMVMCGCGKHYKKPPQTVCHICFMFDSAKTIVGLEEELAKHEWVSVKDRLPETTQTVTSFIVCDEVNIWCDGWAYSHKDRETGDFKYQWQDRRPITHWKPITIPAPKENK
jgi:hypothetical protein